MKNIILYLIINTNRAEKKLTVTQTKFILKGPELNFIFNEKKRKVFGTP